MQATASQWKHQNLLSHYTNEIHKIPMLSREQEKSSAEKAFQGDQVARDLLVRSNLRFVVTIANKYKASGLSTLDLINEGNLGLIKAAERFDPSLGFHFISYAVWWIKQSILFAIQQKSHPIRIPLNRSIELRRLKSAESWLQNNGNGQESSIEDLAGIARLNPVDAHHLLKITKEHISLNAPAANAETGSLIENLADGHSPSQDSDFFQENLKNELTDMLASLSKQEQAIITLRFGLEGHKPLSLQNIGSKMKLSKERIRQIEKKALLKLRNSSAAPQLKAYLSK